jgi:WD40 repeat protein
METPSLGTTTIELPRNTVKPTGGKRLFRRPTWLWDFSFTHDTRQLAAVLREPVVSGDDDYSVMVHDVNYGDVARKIMAPEGEVRGLAFTHGLDSPKVALAIFSGGFAIYTMPYWRPWLMVQGPTVVALAFQPGKDDQVLAVAYTSAVKLYKLEPQGKTTLIGHITNRPLLIPYNSSTPSIQQISFSSSGIRLGVLTQSWVIVLEQEEGGHWTVCHRLSNSGSDIISFQLDEGGSHIACCYDSGAMKMIDVPEGSTLWEASVSGDVYSLSFSPDYDYLGLATSAGVVIVDNQGQELFELAAKIAKGAVIKFSPYGQQIAAASKSGFTVWNLSMS